MDVLGTIVVSGILVPIVKGVTDATIGEIKALIQRRKDGMKR